MPGRGASVQMSTRLAIVSATRKSAKAFWKSSALGISLRRLGDDDRVDVSIAYKNSLGLPVVYNNALTAENAADAVVFIHDDVWIDDYFFVDRILEGLRHFDIIGVAGNRRRVERQPSWAFIDDKLTWDHKDNLSGRVAHSKRPFGAVAIFGPVPAECELLDGVLLAVNRTRLIDAKVQFDTRFDFHFYDLDLCRSARESGLKLGTWPVAITHQSGGAFNSDQWADKRRQYFDKWQE